MVEELKKLEQYALDNNIPIIQKDGLKFIISYINNNNVKKVLEIGNVSLDENDSIQKKLIAKND